MEFYSNPTNEQRINRLRRCYEIAGNEIQFYHIQFGVIEWSCSYFENGQFITEGVGETSLEAFDDLCGRLYTKTFEFVASEGRMPENGADLYLTF